MIQFRKWDETYNLTTEPKPLHANRKIIAVMKFHADPLESFSIKAYGPGWIQLPEEKFEQSLILNTEGRQERWSCLSFEALTEMHLEYLASSSQDAQVILLGTGVRNRFPPAAWLRPFAHYQLGLEVMDTAAACRTFNVLAGEGRKVVAALIVEAPSEPRLP